MSKKYDIEAKNLAKALDIAIDAFTKYPPKYFDEYHTHQIINILIEYKDKAKNNHLKNLKRSIEEALSFFQEGSGDFVDYFWGKIYENNLPYLRENKLLKILKRKKIRDDMEYDFVIDTMVPYYQNKTINDEEFSLLNTLINKFQKKRSENF